MFSTVGSGEARVPGCLAALGIEALGLNVAAPE